MSQSLLYKILWHSQPTTNWKKLLHYRRFYFAAAVSISASQQQHSLHGCRLSQPNTVTATTMINGEWIEKRASEPWAHTLFHTPSHYFSLVIFTLSKNMINIKRFIALVFKAHTTTSPFILPWFKKNWNRCWFSLVRFLLYFYFTMALTNSGFVLNRIALSCFVLDKRTEPYKMAGTLLCGL